MQVGDILKYRYKKVWAIIINIDTTNAVLFYMNYANFKKIKIGVITQTMNSDDIKIISCVHTLRSTISDFNKKYRKLSTVESNKCRKGV